MGTCCSNTEKSERKHRTTQRGVVECKEANDSVEMGKKFKDKGDTKNSQMLAYLQAGEVRSVEQAIDNGFDVNEFIFEGNTENLLLAAVRTTKHPEIIHLILKHGAKIESRNTENGYTALHSACVDLKVELVEALLKYRPSLMVTVQLDKTPSQVDIFTFLREFFIELKSTKRSALTHEEKAKYDKILEMLKQYQFKNADVQELDEENVKIIQNNSGRFDRV